MRLPAGCLLLSAVEVAASLVEDADDFHAFGRDAIDDGEGEAAHDAFAGVVGAAAAGVGEFQQPLSGGLYRGESFAGDRRRSFPIVVGQDVDEVAVRTGGKLKPPCRSGLGRLLRRAGRRGR